MTDRTETAEHKIHDTHVSIGNAAAYLGVSIDTIRRWERAGKLVAHRLDGKNRFFLMSELQYFKTMKPLSVAQVAKILKVSQSTVRRLEEQALLTPDRDKNGKRLYTATDVSEYLTKKESNTLVIQPTPIADLASQAAVADRLARQKRFRTIKLPAMVIAPPVMVMPNPVVIPEAIESAVVEVAAEPIIVAEAPSFMTPVPQPVVTPQLATIVTRVKHLRAPLRQSAPVLSVRAFAGAVRGNDSRSVGYVAASGMLLIIIMALVMSPWKPSAHGTQDASLKVVNSQPTASSLIAKPSIPSASTAQALNLPSTFFVTLPHSGLTVNISNGNIQGSASASDIFAPQQIIGTQIANGSVTSAQIADGSVTLANLAPDLQSLINNAANTKIVTGQATPTKASEPATNVYNSYPSYNTYPTNTYPTYTTETTNATTVLAGLGLTGTSNNNQLTLDLNTGDSTQLVNNKIETKLSSGVATSTTSSGSGLESTLGGLQLLGGCTAGQVLQYDGTAWDCSTVSSGSSNLAVMQNGTTVTPNANNINFSNGFSVTNSAGTANVAINYNNITSVGTITSGTWQGSTLGVQYGGTGGTNFTSKGLVYGNGTGALQSTAAGTSGQLLQAGTGGTPIFNTLNGDATLSATGALTLAASGVTASTYGDATHVPSFTVDAKGRVTAVANTLITGAAPTGAAGGDLANNYPNPSVAKLQGTTLTLGALASGNILIYNGSAFVNQTISGDVSISGAGVATIGAGKVTNNDLANSSLAVTAGTGLTGGGSAALGGSTSLAVAYGSTAGTAAQGNSILSFTGTGNLTGTVSGTAGGGFTTNTLNVGANVTVQGNIFNGASQLVQLSASGKLPAVDGSQLTGVTATNYSGNLAVANGGTGDTTLAANGIVYGNGTTAAGVTAAGTAGQLLQAGTGGTPIFNTLSGDASLSATGVLTLGASGVTASTYGDATHVGQFTVDSKGRITSASSVVITGAAPTGSAGGDLTGNFPSPTIGKLQSNTLTLGTATSGQIIQYNGTAFVNQALSGDVTLSSGGVATIGNGAVSNAKLANSTLTVTAGTGLTGGGLLALGGSTSLAVSYGDTSSTAVAGNKTIICPTGSGNLGGGANTITLGDGGTCSALTISNNPTFTTSVTTPSLQSSGALSVASTGASNALSLSSGSGTINLSATMLATTSNLAVNLANAANETFIIENTGGAVANLNIDSGSLQTNGTSRITNAGVLQNVTANANILTSGTVAVAQGGTGLSGYTKGDLLYASSTSALASLSDVPTGSCLVSGGNGLAPSWGSCAAGGGITGSGTMNTLPIFNSSGVLGNSAISQSAGAVQIGTGNDLNVVGGNFSASGTINAATISGGSLAASSVNGLGLTSTSVSGAGALTVSSGSTNTLTLSSGSGNISTGSNTINGQTISSAANFTGTLALNTLGSAGTTTVCYNASKQLATCGTNAGGVTLQQAYNTSTNPEIVVNSTNGGLTIRDASTALGSNLFEVQNNTGGTTYLGVTAAGTSVAGTLGVTGAVTGGTYNTATISGGSLSSTAVNGVTTANITTLGNSVNVASGLVQLDASNKLPAVDGSKLTNIAATTVANGSITNSSLASGSFTNITAVGTLTSLALTGAITGATTVDGATITGGSLASGSVDGLNVSSTAVGGTAALTVSSGGTSDLTLNSGSGTVVLGASTIKNSGSLTHDLNGTGAYTFTVKNSGTGTADLNINNGGLQIGGTTVLTSSKVLQGVTLSGSLITGSNSVADSVLQSDVTKLGNTVNAASGLVQLNASSQLPAVDGSKLTGIAASTVANGSITNSSLASGNFGNITGVGTLGTLAVTGAVTSGTYNSATISGGTLASGAVNGLNVSSTAVGGTAGLTVSSGGTGILTLTSGSGNIATTSTINGTTLSGGSLSSTAVNGVTTANITTAGNTFNGNSQLVQTTATGKLPALDGSALTNIAATSVANGSITNSSLASGNFGNITGVGTLGSLTVSGAINGLTETSTGISAASGLTLAGGTGAVTISGSGITGAGFVKVDATGKLSSQTAPLTLGTDVTGTYVSSVSNAASDNSLTIGGTASAPTLKVNYGTTAQAAAQGSNTITCPTISGGNFSGGGTVLTIGAASSSCGAITMVNAPSFGGLTTTGTIVDNNAVALTDNVAPTASASTNAQLQLGNNSNITTGSANGTYLGVNQSGSADFLNFQTGTTNELKVTSAGAVTAAGAVSAASLTANGGSIQGNSGLNITAGGGTITGAVGGITNLTIAGTLTGVTNLSLSGTIAGGTTITAASTINSTGGTLQTASTDRIDNAGNLVNINNASLGGTLGVTGLSTLGSLTVTGATNLSTLAVTGLSSLASLTVAGTTGTFASLTLTNSHFKTTQATAPTMAVTTCTATVPTITGTDTDGKVTFTIATAAKCAVTITFNKAYGAAPTSIVVTPTTTGTATGIPYVSSSTTGSFVVTYNVNAGTGAQGFSYFVTE